MGRGRPQHGAPDFKADKARSAVKDSSNLKNEALDHKHLRKPLPSWGKKRFKEAYCFLIPRDISSSVCRKGCDQSPCDSALCQPKAPGPAWTDVGYVWHHQASHSQPAVWHRALLSVWELLCCLYASPGGVQLVFLSPGSLQGW